MCFLYGITYRYRKYWTNRPQCKNNPTTLWVRKGKPRVTKKYKVRKMNKIYVLGAIKNSLNHTFMKEYCNKSKIQYSKKFEYFVFDLFSFSNIIIGSWCLPNILQ